MVNTTTINPMESQRQRVQIAQSQRPSIDGALSETETESEQARTIGYASTASASVTNPCGNSDAKRIRFKLVFKE